MDEETMTIPNRGAYVGRDWGWERRMVQRYRDMGVGPPSRLTIMCLKFEAWLSNWI